MNLNGKFIPQLLWSSHWKGSVPSTLLCLWNNEVQTMTRAGGYWAKTESVNHQTIIHVLGGRVHSVTCKRRGVSWIWFVQRREASGGPWALEWYGKILAAYYLIGHIYFAVFVVWPGSFEWCHWREGYSNPDETKLYHDYVQFHNISHTHKTFFFRTEFEISAYKPPWA